MTRIIAGALLFTLALPAMAEAPSYNYLTLSYQAYELDDEFEDISGDGFGISGSFELGDHWHVVAGYEMLGFDFDIDLDTITAGAGFHTDISQNASIFVDALWLKAKASASGFGSVSEDGYGVATGIRANIADNWELEGGIAYSDLGDGADGWSVGAAGWYKFNDMFSLGLLANNDDEGYGYGIGGRFYFGK